MSLTAVLILSAIALWLSWGDWRQVAVLALLTTEIVGGFQVDPNALGKHWWAVLCAIELFVAASAMLVRARVSDSIIALSLMLVACHALADSLLSPTPTGDPYADAVCFLEYCELLAVAITSRRFVAGVAWLLVKYRNRRPPCNLKTLPSASSRSARSLY